MAKQRLDKWLSTETLSRKEAKQLLKEKRITVNGSIVSDPSFKIDPDHDALCLNGQPIQIKKYSYIMLNKPQGVVSASSDPSDKTVVDILPESLKRKGFFPAGRLDKDTTGFVLVTDNGAFAHRILSPKHHVEKTYIASTTVPVDTDGIRRLETGLELKDGTKFLPASVKKIEECVFEIKIVEGKYHQIKRMFASVGAPLTALHRTQIGGLPLDASLELGQAREISDIELEQITR